MCTAAGMLGVVDESLLFCSEGVSGSQYPIIFFLLYELVSAL